MKVPKYKDDQGVLHRPVRLAVDETGKVHRLATDQRCPRTLRWCDPVRDAALPEVIAATTIIARAMNPRLRTKRRALTPSPSSRTIVRRVRTGGAR